VRRARAFYRGKGPVHRPAASSAPRSVCVPWKQALRAGTAAANAALSAESSAQQMMLALARNIRPVHMDIPSKHPTSLDSRTLSLTPSRLVPQPHSGSGHKRRSVRTASPPPWISGSADQRISGSALVSAGSTATCCCLWAFFRQREDFPKPFAARLSLAEYPRVERCQSLNSRLPPPQCPRGCVRHSCSLLKVRVNAP
jgi:hypothetical protein